MLHVGRQLAEELAKRFEDAGVAAIIYTDIDRDGMLIPDAGWYRDHAEQRNKVAQDYLFINYVCTSGKHYPLATTQQHHNMEGRHLVRDDAA